jgi:two-component system chemotaxis response regulator CheY
MACRILIVDDSVLMRTALRRTIGMVGVEVDRIIEASNGIEALEVLNDEEVDLVLSDLNMPDMGGVELIHRMKDSENYKDVPVVVISTESSETRIKELLEQGIAGYLHKPFTPEEFRSMLTECLGV